MAKKKENPSAAAYARGLFGDVAKRIGKHKYDLDNPEKSSSSKGKKSGTSSTKEYKTKSSRPERLTDEDLYKSQEEGLAELKALREKQRKRADEYKKRK